MKTLPFSIFRQRVGSPVNVNNSSVFGCVFTMDFRSTDFDLAENIFFFHNSKTKPLVFTLDSDTDDGFYFNLLNRFFAEVVDEPNKYSMVLARPEETTYFHRCIPAFNIKFIEDCFKLKDYPDPTQYLIQNSCTLRYTQDEIFDCWFHQKKTWYNLKSVEERNNQSIISSIKPSTHVQNNAHILNSDSDEDLNNFPCRTFISSNKNSNMNTSTNASLNRTVQKNTRLPYTHNEDVRIVKYILKHNHAFDISGRKMWQMMERSNINKIRTWQSLKERYIKTIKYELSSGNCKFPFLKPEELKLLRQGLNIDTIKDSERKMTRQKLQEERIINTYDDSS